MATSKRNPAKEEAEDGDSLPDENLWVQAKRIARKRVKWVWEDRILDSSLTILEGDKSTGKSTIAAQVGVALCGAKNPLKIKGTRNAGALWLSSEEDPSTVIRPRWEAMGGDPSKLHIPRCILEPGFARPVLPHCLSQLETMIATNAIRFVFFDPISSWIAPEYDLVTEGSIRATIGPLAELATRRGVVFLLARHLTKDTSASRLQRGMGGIALGALSRSILLVEHPDRRRAIRTVRVVACNQSTKARLLQWRIESAGQSVRMAVISDTAIEADDGDLSALDPGDRDARQDAETLLKRILKDGFVSAKAILAEAEAAGISPRTVRAAKASLRVTSVRRGSAQPAFWEWGPPREGW